MPVQVLPSVHVHPSDDALEEYLMGRVEEPARSVFEEHLFYCSQCLEAAEAASQFAALLKLGIAEFHAREQHQPASQRWFGLRPRSAARLWSGWVRPAWPPCGRWSERLSLATAGAALAAVLALALLTWRPQMGAPAAVVLVALRGSDAGSVAHAPAGRPLDVSIDAARLPGATYSLQIVDANGTEVWQGPVSLERNMHLAARVPKPFRAGAYWVRLHQSSAGPPSRQRTEGLVREFGLRIE